MTLNEMRKKVKVEREEEEEVSGFVDLHNMSDAGEKGEEESSDLSTALKLLEDSVDLFEEILSAKKKDRKKKVKKLAHEITAFLSMYINEEV